MFMNCAKISASSWKEKILLNNQSQAGDKSPAFLYEANKKQDQMVLLLRYELQYCLFKSIYNPARCQIIR